MINDAEFARKWIEARRRSKNLGNRAIKQELFQKGVDREIIEEAISHQRLAIREDEIAEQALKKRINSWGNLEPLEFKKKAFGYLARKGFEFDVINKVVEKTLKEW